MGMMQDEQAIMPYMDDLLSQFLSNNILISLTIENYFWVAYTHIHVVELQNDSKTRHSMVYSMHHHHK